MNEFVFLSWPSGNTWNRNSSFKYFRVVRIEKQICSFVFGRIYGSASLFRDLLTFSLHCTAIRFRVEQRPFREPPVLKTGSLWCEHDPCNESRFSQWLKQVLPVRIWVQGILVFITGTGFAVCSAVSWQNTLILHNNSRCPNFINTGNILKTWLDGDTCWYFISLIASVRHCYRIGYMCTLY